MSRQLTRAEMAPPGSAEWQRTVTASKVASMLRDPETGEYLGIGYNSAYDQWCYMSGIKEKSISGMEEHFLYGHCAEPAARLWWIKHNPEWRVSPGEVAYTDESLPYPNQVTIDLRASRGSKRRILEVKAPLVNNGVEEKWQVQVQDQMRTSGIHQATIIIWPVWGFPTSEDIEYDPDLAQAIVRDAAAFYELIEAGTPPDAEDSELYQELHALSQPRAIVDDADVSDLADEYAAAVASLAAAEKNLKVIDNEIVARMGGAMKAVAEGQTVVTRKSGRFAQSRIPDEHKHLLKDPELQEAKFSPSLLKKHHPEIHAEALGADTFTFERASWK